MTQPKGSISGSLADLYDEHTRALQDSWEKAKQLRGMLDRCVPVTANPDHLGRQKRITAS